MSFRVSALVSAIAVLGLSSATPVSAQPIAPTRPGYSGFSSIFTPGQQNQLLLRNNNLVGPLAGGVGGPLVGPGFVNPGLMGGIGGPQGIGYPGSLAYPQVLPGALGVNPALPASGIVGTFNNYGHWYGRGYGNYGHWYPLGIRNGRGVLGFNGTGFGAGSGGLYGGLYGGAGGAISGGTGGSGIGTVGGAALGLGSTINQFRR